MIDVDILSGKDRLYNMVSASVFVSLVASLRYSYYGLSFLSQWGYYVVVLL